jgi:3-methyladenine DNA glycosylase AlkD
MKHTMANDRVLSIRKELRRLADKDIAEHSQRFFKTGKGQYGQGDRFLGIRVPALRKIVRQYRGVSVEEASRLLKSEFHEERLLGLFLLVAIFKKANDEGRRAIYTLYLENTRFINNWDLVDCSAGHIVGAYLRGSDKQPLYDLAVSDSLWERRIAIMSTFGFIKHNEFTDTLRIAKILLKDKEDLIHKAAGWMLREIGRRDIEAEEKFLQKYYRQMPRTMLRYAIERFPAPKRQKYLNGDVQERLTRQERD